MSNSESWYETREVTPERLALACRALEDVRNGEDPFEVVRHYPFPEGGYMPKSLLVAAYHHQVQSGAIPPDPALLARIRMKPVRTLSGVTTVTVLTGPHECPGECIFCPSDGRMPKSYLPDEPGAARAYQHNFDPFRQVESRLASYRANGHPTDKVELLILGGTWSRYPRAYQEEFVRRCFDAMNGFPSATLAEAQLANESAAHRNVGLVIETRPDEITPEELAWLRRLGVTKVQMGAQSMDEDILLRNKRGHTVAQTVRACALLRAAGFKIVLHWMPNLLGATLESDRADFARLWEAACPDELKIYPTQLLEHSELYERWQLGEYKPYTMEELIALIADLKPTIPAYCRVNRIIRDIPSTHVIEGNKRTSLRMDIIAEVTRRGQTCGCIRCHEVRGQTVDPDTLTLEDRVYHPQTAEDHFLHFRTPDGQIAGYLRLSLPQSSSPQLGFADLEGAALIREVHVYGQSLPVGTEQGGAAQHAGLGTRLLNHAAEVARQHGFRRLAVIAAIGTRPYYAARGFESGELYMVQSIAG